MHDSIRFDTSQMTWHLRHPGRLQVTSRRAADEYVAAVIVGDAAHEVCLYLHGRATIAELHAALGAVLDDMTEQTDDAPAVQS